MVKQRYFKFSRIEKDSTSKKEGTVANINAKLTTKNSNGVKVIAKNTLKGYNSDTSNITNANLTGGMSSTGASVLVTDMKYNTTAKISGGSVEALMVEKFKSKQATPLNQNKCRCCNYWSKCNRW